MSCGAGIVIALVRFILCLALSSRLGYWAAALLNLRIRFNRERSIADV